MPPSGRFLYSCVLAILAAGLSARAGDAVQVSDVQCQQASCEAARSATTGDAGVRIVGQASKQANQSLGVVILDESQKVVHNGRIRVKEDGAFRALLPAGTLAAGKYKFGLITLDRPPSVVAAGSFTLTAETAAAGREPKGSGGSTAAAPAPSQASVPPQAPAASGGGFFFRTFGLAIPGVAYTTDNYATNTRTVTVASGYVTKSAIRINPDGTYVWNSAWDGKIIQGQWKQQGGAIIVLKGQSGLDWRMERMAKPAGDAVVTLWDQNSIWYNGTPLGGK